jgi:hypothetical protein
MTNNGKLLNIKIKRNKKDVQNVEIRNLQKFGVNEGKLTKNKINSAVHVSLAEFELLAEPMQNVTLENVRNTVRKQIKNIA